MVRWGTRAVKALLSSNGARARGKEGLRVGVNDVRKLLVVIVQLGIIYNAKLMLHPWINLSLS